MIALADRAGGVGGKTKFNTILRAYKKVDQRCGKILHLLWKIGLTSQDRTTICNAAYGSRRIKEFIHRRKEDWKM